MMRDPLVSVCVFVAAVVVSACAGASAVVITGRPARLYVPLMRGLS